jgi:hypothetical protein
LAKLRENHANITWLLATFGEPGWVEGFSALSGPQEGRETRAVTGGKFLHFPRRGAHALDFTKIGQEPITLSGQNGLLING